MCEYFTPHTVFYVFGRSSFRLYVNSLRLIPRFIGSDVPVVCEAFTPDTVLYWFGRCSFGVCEAFTPDTVFYAFGRCSFGVCVNGLRSIPCFPRSDTIFWVVCEWFTYTTAFSSFIWYYFRLYVNDLRLISCFLRSECFSRDDTVTVLRMFCPVVRLPGRVGTVCRDA